MSQTVTMNHYQMLKTLKQSQDDLPRAGLFNNLSKDDIPLAQQFPNRLSKERVSAVTSFFMLREAIQSYTSMEDTLLCFPSP